VKSRGVTGASPLVSVNGPAGESLTAITVARQRFGRVESVVVSRSFGSRRARRGQSGCSGAGLELSFCMTAPDAPDRPVPPSTVAVRDRRSGGRGHLEFFWNLCYRGLRQMGGHAEKFYLTVGIFLLVGIVVAIVGTLAFAELGEWVKKGYTQRFDVAGLQWLAAHHTPLLTTIMTEITPLGTGIVVMTTVGVTAAFLWHTEHKISAQLLLAATAGNIILNNVLKLYFDRARPNVFAWQTHAASSSFPSGHAMSATVVYGTIAYLLARLQKHAWSRAITLVTAVVMIALICLTRLYLGVHYPSDVGGGIIVGLAWAAFCMATLEASLVLARRRGAPVLAHEAVAPVEKVPVVQQVAQATATAEERVASPTG
jgi:undecaprenyl-diphosphatase